jgi:hypothetical protein
LAGAATLRGGQLYEFPELTTVSVGNNAVALTQRGLLIKAGFDISF